MNPNDRCDLIFEVSESMNDTYDKGYTAEEVRECVIGFAKGWRATEGGSDK